MMEPVCTTESEETTLFTSLEIELTELLDSLELNKTSEDVEEGESDDKDDCAGH